MRGMNEIRQHVRAVEQTKKITGAMNLISSARVKKIAPAMAYNKAYLEKIEDAMHAVLSSSESFDHHYLRPRPSGHTTFVVVAGDKGMVGSYNNDILKYAQMMLNECENRTLITIGVEAKQFFKKQGIRVDQDIAGASQNPSLFYAREIVQGVLDAYNAHLTDKVYLIYMGFENTVKWRPTAIKLLPVTTLGIRPEERHQDMVYHPSAEEVFRLIVPQYLLGILYGALMQAYASEHCARMNAMQSATRNADALLSSLRSAYNLARQAQITQEITEITGAALAQTGGRG